MNANNLGSELLLWVDVETTGLDPAQDKLLEVAAIVTDVFGNEISNDFNEVIYHPSPEEARDSANSFVQAMHDATGLWEKLPEGKELVQVDELLLKWLKNYAPNPRQARLAGSSCTLDANFLNAYLPSTYGHLHYRMVDVSGLAYVAASWGLVEGYYEKKKVHSALSDIRESLEEYRWVMNTLNSHKNSADVRTYRERW